jgi:hypothetical protein
MHGIDRARRRDPAAHIAELPMMIIDAIRDASTEHEIQFLLTAYVEAVRYCDKLDILPGGMKDLPLAGVDDLKARVDGLKAGLGGMNDRDRLVVREAMVIFTVALARLGSLEKENLGQLPIAA